MEIYLFDMDGVLLHARGYHRALQETVRLAGESLGRSAIHLSQAQIDRFEALGVSSEWHSSALCLAVLMIEEQTGVRSAELDLQALFAALEAQSLGQPALERGLAALTALANRSGIALDGLTEVFARSESIEHSLTMNWFQELVLGSQAYQSLYRKPPRFSNGSYLQMYDERKLSPQNAERILAWAGSNGRAAAIMTNRPSSGPPNFAGAPDAEMGAALVGLNSLPLIGFGEITWLAERTEQEVGTLTKPSQVHALAAILAAISWPVEDSLHFAAKEPEKWELSGLVHLHGGRVTVFEDTPGGMLAVQAARDLLFSVGIELEIRKIGIAADESKRAALAAQGAAVFPEIDQALASLDDFRAFSAD